MIGLGKEAKDGGRRAPVVPNLHDSGIGDARARPRSVQKVVD